VGEPEVNKNMLVTSGSALASSIVLNGSPSILAITAGSVSPWSIARFVVVAVEPFGPILNRTAVASKSPPS